MCPRSPRQSVQDDIQAQVVCAWFFTTRGATSAQDATQEATTVALVHDMLSAWHTSQWQLCWWELSHRALGEIQISRALLNGILRCVSAFSVPLITHPKVLPRGPQWVFSPEWPKGPWVPSVHHSPRDWQLRLQTRAPSSSRGLCAWPFMFRLQVDWGFCIYSTLTMRRSSYFPLSSIPGQFDGGSGLGPGGGL